MNSALPGAKRNIPYAELGIMAIYTNGILAAINRSVTIGFNSVSNFYSWIGRSLYSGDPYPDFALDEFRLYNGALSASQIAATDALGPGQLLSTANPVMAATATAGSLTLSWPLASAGFTLMSRTNLVTGSWTPVASPVPQMVGQQWQVILPLAGNAQFYQLQK